MKFLPLLLVAVGLVLGDEEHIHSLNEFIEFSNNVNSGSIYYEGTTVYLDSDIEFTEELSQQFKMINNFYGAFDGQGYTISNLNITSSSEYAGLFGSSRGMTVRNVVLDSSCSITSYSSETAYYDVYVGGIIGYCYGFEDNCIIESSVNMGSVTSTGEGSYLNIGGIVGYLESYEYDYNVIVKNCANYGSINYSGEVDYLYAGGIVGYSYGYDDYIYNSINYGTFAIDRIAYRMYVGGITGQSDYDTVIENCVSAGMVTTTTTTSDIYIGSIVGQDEGTIIRHSFWTCDAGTSKISGRGYPDADDSVKQITVDSDTLKELNDYSWVNSLNGWLLNANNKSVSFTMNNSNKKFVLKSQIILLPSLANKGKELYEWYSDSSHTTLFTETEVDSGTELYGVFKVNNNRYTITFITNEGTFIDPITSEYSSSVSLPNDTTKDDCTFVFWKDELGKEVPFNFTVPARNVTLTEAWMCAHITSAEGLIELKNNTNIGATYEGFTVYLDSDIEFTEELSKQFGVINNFYGVFDGQGHIISNLKITSSLNYAGLFGCSDGITVRNVVLDSSCSISSSHFSSSSDVCVGGIIGYCYGFESNCTIENSVNMASVTSTGESDYLCLGGIVGYIRSSNSGEYNVIIKNCANYGSINYSGEINYLYAGGIVGRSYGCNDYIYNSINYGTFAIGGTADTMYVGGITGSSDSDTVIENCVSAGMVTTTTATSDIYIGSIVGYDDSTIIRHSFWTCDAGTSEISEDSSSSVDDAAAKQITVDSDALKELNDYSSNSAWNGWLLNANNKSVSFVVNRNKGFTLNSQIILLPFPADNSERSFGEGWYNDKALTVPFTASGVDSDTTLYGMFCGPSNYTVTLDANGGDALGESERSVSVACNETYGALPTPTRTGHKFEGWFTASAGGDKVEAGSEVVFMRNHTLYAQWSINKYTVTFVFNNSVDADKEVIFEYGAEIVYPVDNPTKEGHTFNGWNSSDVLFMPAYNFTIAAQWSINKYTVTFDLGNGTTVNMTFEHGEEIVFPAGTEREGYTFSGWYADSGLTIPFEETSAMRETVAYAKYVATPSGASGSGESQSNSDESDKKRGSFSAKETPLASLLVVAFACLLVY